MLPRNSLFAHRAVSTSGCVVVLPTDGQALGWSTSTSSGVVVPDAPAVALAGLADAALTPGHFMPAALLESQLATLEPPTADERPLVADISPPPEDLAAWIEARLGDREPGT